MSIFQVVPKRRYWVIRAEGGKYYDHFTRYGVVALGHLDELRLPDSNGPFRPNIDRLKESMEKQHQGLGKKARHTSARFNQAKAFLAEIQTGDWIITIGYQFVRFGRVTGHACIDKAPLTIVYDAEKDRKTTMNYSLRRKVAWGPVLKRTNLPFGLQASFKANQSLFNIDPHWEAIHHSLYPFFQKDNQLFLSASLKTKKDVSNYNIVKFLSILNEIEVIGKEINNNLSVENFDIIFKKQVENNKLTLTTKAQFHSPGDIWNALTFVKDLNVGNAMTYTVVAYSMLFGNKLAGFDGLIDLQTRQKLWDLVINRINKSKVDKVVETLDLTPPVLDTKVLESPENDDDKR